MTFGRGTRRVDTLSSSSFVTSGSVDGIPIHFEGHDGSERSPLIGIPCLNGVWVDGRGFTTLRLRETTKCVTLRKCFIRLEIRDHSLFMETFYDII